MLKIETNPRKIFWIFVHNALIHPLMAFPIQFKFVDRWHDWTAEKCWGKGNEI